MSQRINICMHPVKKCLLKDAREDLGCEIKGCDHRSNKSSSSDKSISFDITESSITQIDTAVPLCSCCRPMDFPTDESKRLYEEAAKKGRRGVVLSLEIDQTTSYVTTLSSNEHLKFRFQMPNSKHAR